MRSARTILAIGVAAAGTLVLAACGSDRGAVTAPSSVQAVVTPASASVVTSGEFLPHGAVNTTTPITVTSLVSGTSCPTLQFMVSSYSFNVDTATQYSGGTCANIQPGAKINFNGTRLSETSGVFYVTTLSFVTSTTTPTPTPPPTSPTPTPTPVQTEGTITATGAGMCPELQFFFGSYAFNVSYATQYSGGTCADLKAGAKVAIVGTKKDTESFVRVTTLAFKGDGTPAPQPPTNPTIPVSADVTVSSLVSGTSCPNLSFMVGPYKISLSSATTFERGACVDIAAGKNLGLTGTRQSDGVITASKIVFRDTTTTPTSPTNPSGRPVEGEGVITALKSGTSCPALAFYIGTYLITLDLTTVFDRGACSDLGTGTRVHVKGAWTGDSAVAASQISVQSDSPGRPVVEGEGRVSSLVAGTACPALTFMIEGYTVSLDASTSLVGGACADVAAGRKLGVKGTVTGDKQVLATQIVFKSDGQ